MPASVCSVSFFAAVGYIRVHQDEHTLRRQILAVLPQRLHTATATIAKTSASAKLLPCYHCGYHYHYPASPTTTTTTTSTMPVPATATTGTSTTTYRDDDDCYDHHHYYHYYRF